jgi:hypothetical protein
MSFKSDHINQTQLNPHAPNDMFHMVGLHKVYSILIILMLVNNISLGTSCSSKLLTFEIWFDEIIFTPNV